MIRQMHLTFQGSFQCRLATDGASKNASPKLPASDPTTDNGWTFAYNEPPFDRVIRLGNPISLRKELALDPWKDTQVTMVAVDRANGRGLEVVRTDPLLGQVVSLGKAKFDADVGDGATREALVDFFFSIGKKLVAGEARPMPKSPGVTETSTWETEYMIQKRKLLTSASAALTTSQPLRYKVLTDQPFGASTFVPGFWISNYADKFKFEGPYPSISLKDVTFAAVNGVIKEMGSPRQYNWALDLTFYRFDGDTLTGLVNGTLGVQRP
jgi:hypothetical protein